jgi:hypothetical protein
MVPGATATVTITAVTKARGVFTNSASVGSSAGDPNPANNADTEETTVGR